MDSKKSAELDCVLALKDRGQIAEFRDVLAACGGDKEFFITIRIDTSNMNRSYETGCVKDITLFLQEDGAEVVTDSESTMESLEDVLDSDDEL